MELGGFPSNYRKKLAQPMLARPLGLELESKLGHRSVRKVGVSQALVPSPPDCLWSLRDEGRRRASAGGPGGGVCVRTYAKERVRGRETDTEITDEQKQELAGEAQEGPGRDGRLEVKGDGQARQTDRHLSVAVGCALLQRQAQKGSRNRLPSYLPPSPSPHALPSGVQHTDPILPHTVQVTNALDLARTRRRWGA